MEAVPGRLHHLAATLPTALPAARSTAAEERVVTLERRHHLGRVLLPEPGGTLEIGEQERHRSRRQLRHDAPSGSGRPHDRTPERSPAPDEVSPAPKAVVDAATAPPNLHVMQEGTPTAGATETVHPELVDDAAESLAAVQGEAAADEAGEQVPSPTKLIRIASMVRTMLDEVRRAPLDDAGRRPLARDPRAVARRSSKGMLSPDLQKELDEVVLPFTAETPSESELRIAQAQLVGWLEGLFHGIQATLFTQQAMAQQQFEEMRRRREQRSQPRRRAAYPRAPPGAYL